MATMEEYLRQPVGQRLARLERTAEDLAGAMRGHGAADLARRPAPKKGSAVEVGCHLRDIEELCILRFHTMLAMDNPKLFVLGVTPPDPAQWGIGGGVPYPVDPDRWAEERQYLRNDAGEALAAFRRRRLEVLPLLRGLSPEQWARGGIHPMRRRMIFGEWVAQMAAHDDKHLGELSRALETRT